MSPDECRPVEVAVDAEADFEGHAGRECGEHRPTGLGGRAWCFDCSEWCYPSAASALRTVANTLTSLIEAQP